MGSTSNRHVRRAVVSMVTTGCLLAGVLSGAASANSTARIQFQYSRFGLHYAGPHSSKANTCDIDFDTFQCGSPGASDYRVDATGGAGRYDIYVVALCVDGDLAGARYGICCSGQFYFYGWSRCSDLELPTSGWPDCGEANAQTWTTQQSGSHVVMGILDVYAYGEVGSLGLCPDQRVGYAEYCDGATPSPHCRQLSQESEFSVVGFGVPGYDACPCYPCPVQATTWGSVKSLYQ